MGNQHPSTPNVPSKSSIAGDDHLVTLPEARRESLKAPSIRIRRSEPNVRAIVKDPKFFSQIDKKRGSVFKPTTGFDNNLLGPDTIETSSAGSRELDFIPSPRHYPSIFSKVFEEPDVSQKVSQPKPDEMYPIGEDSPSKVDQENSIVFDFRKSIRSVSIGKDALSSLSSIIGDDKVLKIKDHFDKAQEKLRGWNRARIANIVKFDVVVEEANYKVYRVFNKLLRKFYALKVIEVTTEQEMIHAWEQISTLVKIQSLRNPSLLKVYDIEYESFFDGMNQITNFSLLMEIGLTNLQDYSEFRASHNFEWNEEELIEILFGLLKQSLILNEHGIYHRDIKPKHVIINQALNRIKLKNFESAYQSHHKHEKVFQEELDVVGTPFFLAPELGGLSYVQKRTRYDPSLSDIYSIALTVVKVFEPNLQRNALDKVLGHIQTRFPRLFSYLSGLLNENPESRKFNFALIRKELVDKEIEITVKESTLLNDYLFSKLLKKLDGEHCLNYIVNLRNIYLLKEAKAIVNYRIIQEEGLNPFSETVAKLITMKALILLDSGSYEKSIEEFKKACEVYSKIKGENGLKIARIYDGIAKAYRSLGKYEEALEMIRKSLSLREKSQENQKSEISNSYESIGQVLLCQGKLEEAHNYFEKAYYSKKLIFGDNHIEVARSLQGLGCVYEIKGKFSDALELYKKVLELRVNHHGEVHPKVGHVHHHIGNVYESQGKYHEALKEYEKSLEIKNKCIGENHLDTALTLNKIGTVYKHSGRYAEALKMQYKSLNIKKHFLGENHPEIASSYHSIGTLYFSLKKYGEALRKFNDAFDINYKHYGDDHPAVALGFLDIASCNQAQGQFPLAIANYKKALKILTKHKRDKHADTAMIYNNMGAIYEKLGQFDEALGKYKESLAIKLALYGQEHPSTAVTYNNMGLVYEKQGKFQEALDKFNQALEIKLRHCGTKHPSVASTYSNIGLAYCKQGRADIALEMHDKALAIKKANFGENDLGVADSYFNIAAALRYQGKKLDAKKYYLDALEIYYKHYDDDKHPKIMKIKKIIDNLK